MKKEKPKYGFKKPVSVIMVVYNEEDHIKRLIMEYYNEIYQRLVAGSEYIIYLDKPTDNTAAIVKELAKDIKIRVIDGKKNLGYAGATTRALLSAKNYIIFYSDSSGKHNAKDFWKLIKLEGKYDIVNGLRKPRSDPIVRRIITFFQRIMVSILFFIPFYDFNTGYKIMHKNIVDNVVKDCKYMKQNFSTEMLLRAYKKGYTIHDVPVKFTGRKNKYKGTNYRELPGITFRSLIGFLKLRFELMTT